MIQFFIQFLQSIIEYVYKEASFRWCEGDVILSFLVKDIFERMNLI